jgi:murein DD-endopeptidase MepM/ murein hydrolase activator NlpD
MKCIHVIFLVLYFILPTCPKPQVIKPPLSVASSHTTKLSFFSMPVRGHIISPFGRRNGRRHTGIDIAVKSGIVHFVGRVSGYGNFVIIKHSDNYVTRYAHCSVILVKKNQKVSAEEIIAKVGSTGRSTGAHLHFEVMRNGMFLDPVPFLELAKYLRQVSIQHNIETN